LLLVGEVVVVAVVEAAGIELQLGLRSLLDRQFP
jgi:hypothetical protein